MHYIFIGEMATRTLAQIHAVGKERKECCRAAQTPATEPSNGHLRGQLRAGKVPRNAAINERCYLTGAEQGLRETALKRNDTGRIG